MKRGTDDKGNQSGRPSRQEPSAPSTTTATDEDPLAIWMPLFGQSGEFPMVLPTLVEEIENKPESTPTAPTRPSRQEQTSPRFADSPPYARGRPIRRPRPPEQAAPVSAPPRQAPVEKPAEQPTVAPIETEQAPAPVAATPGKELSRSPANLVVEEEKEKDPHELTVPTPPQQGESQEPSSSEPAPEPPHTSSSALVPREVPTVPATVPVAPPAPSRQAPPQKPSTTEPKPAGPSPLTVPVARRPAFRDREPTVELELHEIAGHLTFTRTEVTAWYRLPDLQWAFRADKERVSLIMGIAAQYASLAGYRHPSAPHHSSLPS